MARRRTRKSELHPVFVIGVMLVAIVVCVKHLPTTEAIAIGLIVGAIGGYRIGRRRAVPAPRTRKSVKPPAEPAPLRKPRLPATFISAACAADECGVCTDKGCQHCDHPERAYRNRPRHYEVPEEPPY